ncbi:hypothetical protein PIB19_07695 [Sphingomonas sp. 7/4-4]|nr:hypothetical protein [Sphingomonas sp. 7/4-4]WBY09845.1 hypothetical protein PIB19_07695 [Sphingomonas sp. 7/4-4]
MPHPDPRPELISPLQPAAIRALFGPGVAVATARAVATGDGLFAEEQRYIAEVGATRQAEFGTARICARRALAELGIAPARWSPIRIARPAGRRISAARSPMPAASAPPRSRQRHISARSASISSQICPWPETSSALSAPMPSAAGSKKWVTRAAGSAS